MATVQFSLTAAQLETLQRLSNPGESLNLTAKRILSEVLVRGNILSNIDNVESEPTDLTSTEWQLRGLIAELQERIDKIEADRLSQDHRFGVHIETLEDRIDKLETEIEMITTPKQPATPNNAELVIFLADPEGEPIQFWSGQIWVDDLDLAYRYKSAQAMARAIDKLKKRKLSGDDLLKASVVTCAPIEKLLTSQDYNSSAP